MYILFRTEIFGLYHVFTDLAKSAIIFWRSFPWVTVLSHGGIVRALSPFSRKWTSDAHTDGLRCITVSSARDFLTVFVCYLLSVENLYYSFRLLKKLNSQENEHFIWKRWTGEVSWQRLQGRKFLFICLFKEIRHPANAFLCMLS